jgi:preprotein translocase subunit YajC
MNYLLILLQDAAEPGPGGGGMTWIFMLGILVVFYFFMIRPQMKRQKEEKKFREGLEKGDKVLTLGGIYGKIVSLDDTSALIQVDDNVKIRFDKTALRAVPDTETKTT